MTTDNQQQDVQVRARLNTSLDLKDLITIVSAAVSITFAWGVFNTRISSLEQKVIAQEQENQAQKETIRRLEQRTQENTIYLDQLYSNTYKSAPRRAQ
jgi:HAMP domain-containing protein